MFSKLIRSSRPLVLVLALAGALLLLPGSAKADVPPSEVPESLQAAIRATVEERGELYAGLCRDVNESNNPSQYVGQWCAFVQSLSADRAEVTLGPVLSNEIHAVTFVRSGDAWVVWAASPPPPAQLSATPQQAATAQATPAPQQPAVPADLQAAIKAAVEARGERYAGLCREVNQSPNPSQYAGQWCAFVQSLSADRADVTFGPVLSNELHRVSFVRSGGKWAVAVADVPPKPPRTGNAGLADDSRNQAAVAIAIGLGIIVVGALQLARRHS